MIFQANTSILIFCVLGVIQQSDQYGYSLTQIISARMDISESTLYPILRKLQKEQLLQSYDVQHEGRNRRYYTITPQGSQTLRQYQDEWLQYRSGIEYLTGGTTKL